MVFKASLDSAGLFKDSIDSINAVINDGTFLINSNGISLVAMDSASVAMVVFDFLSSSFREFSASEEIKISLSINQLRTVLARAQLSDSITMELDKENNQFKIIIKGQSTKKFSLPLLQEQETLGKVPPLEFSTKIEMDAKTMKEWVKDMLIVGDCVGFYADSEKFELQSTGNNINANMNLTKDNPALFSIEAKEETKAKYSLEYLDKMMKAAKVADRLSIEFKKDYPLKMEFKNLDKMRIAFILAPRVEND